MDNTVRAHIFFSGTVQGVGFRYTTKSYATSLDVSGWVKNLSDGRVEMVVESSQENIDRLCKQLEDHFDGYIRKKEIHFEEVKDEFAGFNVRF